MPYEYLPQSGDIGIRLWASSIDELMRSAVHAFTDAVVDRACVRETAAGHVTCRAGAPDLLLHEWLSEVLFLFDARRQLIADADVTVTRDAGDWLLDARTRGEPVDAARQHLKVLVKGVTYHALSVTETPEGWQGSVILDI